MAKRKISKRFNIYGPEVNGIAEYIGFIYSESEEAARHLLGQRKEGNYTLIEQKNALLK